MIESPTSLKHIDIVQPTEFFLEPMKQESTSERESSPSHMESPCSSAKEVEEKKEHIPAQLQMSVNVDCSPPRRRPAVEKSLDNSFLKNSMLNSSYSETLKSHKITAYKN
mmetsp:Transcript_33493/g.51430  ORF Transcript_33493/g.51430 Transcript_33493/m.51430 type:complete len:110 (-) Transcript_33493:1211-1540(-)